MKIRIIAVGQLKDGPESDLLHKYIKRLQWKIDIQQVVVKKKLQGAELKQAEADLIFSCLPPHLPLIVLDERGKNLTSQQFADYLQKLPLMGHSEAAFCIGGAEGLCEKIRSRAQLIISFGSMTWPHMLIRTLLIEQLYRAQQIILGHPYHKV